MQSGSLADAVQRRWAAWRDRAREQGARVPESEAFVTTLQRVWEGSDYVAQSMERDPALPAALLDSGELLAQYGPGTLDRLLRDRLLDVRDEPALHRVLRLFRRRQMVRIIWRDLAGWATLE
jgi:glutamate-ammonia-ligase adenylyltransferase